MSDDETARGAPPTPPGIVWDEGGPTIEEYIALRAAAGMSPRSRAAARAGLGGGLYTVAARLDGRAVGMGRVAGDGGTCFLMLDLAVDPTMQGQGIGTAIFARMVAFAERVAPPTAVLMLLADVPADRLYARFGFRPSAPRSIGMIRRIPE